jgi:hypothetical protein
VGRSQRERGKRGERDAAAALTALGYPARRGVQYQGGPNSADLSVAIQGLHWEVKFVEREQVRAWMAQAEGESGGKLPVVLHRKARSEWLLTLPLERVNEFIERMAEARDQSVQKVGPAELPN